MAAIKVAVIGSGITGLGAAWSLNQHNRAKGSELPADASKPVFDVTLYEKGNYFGGHTSTADAPNPDGKGTTPVDTGFIVFNKLTYPNFINFIAELDVPFETSDMSFSLSLDHGKMEWAGDNLNTLFAQRANIFNWAFVETVYDIVRFIPAGIAFLAEAEGSPRAADRAHSMTLRQFLDEHNFSQGFREFYLLPMSAAIWSTPNLEILDFPAHTLIRFFQNHRFLQLSERPQWLTISKGSREYVKKVLAQLKDTRLNTPVVSVRQLSDKRFEVEDASGKKEVFDRVVFAVHGDQVLPILKDATPEEKEVLGAFKYKANRAILHRDPKFMPKMKEVWSSWNYLSKSDLKKPDVSLTYWMNRLQNIDPANPLFVTLNPMDEPDPKLFISDYIYEHPTYTMKSVDAQKKLDSIQGKRNLYFGGAWTNWGFHEDGLTAGLKVAQMIGAEAPFALDLDHTEGHALPELSAFQLMVRRVPLATFGAVFVGLVSIAVYSLFAIVNRH